MWRCLGSWCVMPCVFCRVVILVFSCTHDSCVCFRHLRDATNDLKSLKTEEAWYRLFREHGRPLTLVFRLDCLRDSFADATHLGLCRAYSSSMAFMVLSTMMLFITVVHEAGECWRSGHLDGRWHFSYVVGVGLFCVSCSVACGKHVIEALNSTELFCVV